MRLNVDREPGFYHDESGERFQQLFHDAEKKREEKLDAFWVVVTMATFITICLALAFAKLYSMGAVEGVK